jgi:RNA polymerase sigma factor for flagellar operon FliA
MNHRDTKSASTKPMDAPTALEEVLLRGLPQVQSIARGIHHRLPSHVPLDDLIQAGILGLIDAFYKFDLAKHVMLKSYARFRIRGAILDSLREMDWGPRRLRRQARQVERARHTLHARLGRIPGEEDLADEMNMSLQAFQRLKSALHGLSISNLESELADARTDREVNKSLSAAIEMDPFSICFLGEMKLLIERAQEKFNDNERRTLNLHYFKEYTLREVGMALGVGESRASQIHSKALNHLRESLGKILRSRKRDATETNDVYADPNKPD